MKKQKQWDLKVLNNIGAQQHEIARIIHNKMAK